jgi:1-acyl-sn-glycerol-3-phosphate acyltransferase
MTTARSLLFVFWLYASMTLIGLAYVPAVMFSADGPFGAMRTWARATLFGLRWICGARVVIEGREHLPEGAGLIALKHQSMLDTILPALLVRRPTFVFKRELSTAPIFGWYLKRAGMVPVDRDAHATALKAMVRAARAAIAGGRQFLIFPEGTRQNLDAPPDYKPGVAALYKDLGIPCTPVALNTGLVWPAHGFKRYPGTVTLRILPPIPAGLARDDFMREVETRIETAGQDLLPPHLRRSQTS